MATPADKKTYLADTDTMPKLLLVNARRFAKQHAIREKHLGIWVSWTWAEYAQETRLIAYGLAELGFRCHDKLAIIGDNRPPLYAAMCAAQSLGGTPVPLYQDSVAQELQFIIKHAQTRFAIVEDQEQVDKLLEIAEQLSLPEVIIYCDPRGLRHYQQSSLHDYAEVRRHGRERATHEPDFYAAQVEQTKGGDDAVVLYTSGTTGSPKGVVLTHRNIIVTARNSAKFDNFTAKEQVMAYLPMAWVGDHIFSYGQAFVCGFCVCCPESKDTLLSDLKEIGPTYFFAPPRIFEDLRTSVMIRMENAQVWKQRLFHYCIAIAREVGIDIMEGRRVGSRMRLLYALGDFLIYRPLKDTLGLSRIRVAYTAGEAIGSEIFEFYRSLGINIKQLYGQTEASVFVTMQADDDVRSNTTGVPAPGVEVQVSDSGEVLYRGPGDFKCYYNNAEATRKTKTEDGWVRTGDAGFFDRGHLRIIDRAADVGKLNDGTLFAPKYLENKLRFFSYLKEAVAFGDQRDYVTALINIDLDAVANWAERNDLMFSSYQELAADPQVRRLVHDCVIRVNADLAADAKLAASQIRRFIILHKELDADDGELTRTHKVRRRIINERYAPLVKALFSGRSDCQIETEVMFDNGRRGTISGNLKIEDVALQTP